MGNLADDPPPMIELLMIFAGPPGAGKTTLAEALIAGERFEQLAVSLPKLVVRTEIQSMRGKDYHRGTLIVEFSTIGVDVASTVAEIERLIDVAQRKLVVTWQIDRFSLTRQYAKRMAKERLRRTPEWMRYLRFGKLKQLTAYMFSRRIEHGYRKWAEILRSLPNDETTQFLRVASRYGEHGHYQVSDDRTRLDWSG
jgi:adenylate kinase family enzyme